MPERTHKGQAGFAIKNLVITILAIALIITIALLIKTVAPSKFGNFSITQDAKITLSENDTRLVEAFVQELNLLDAVLLSDSYSFKAQLARFKAASNNIQDLGSSTVKELVGADGLGIEISYDLAHTLFATVDSTSKQKCSDAIDEARKLRDDFVKAYQLIQKGVPRSEFVKFRNEQYKVRYPEEQARP